MNIEELKALALAGMLVAVAAPADVSAQPLFDVSHESSYYKHGCCYGPAPLKDISGGRQVETRS